MKTIRHIRVTDIYDINRSNLMVILDLVSLNYGLAVIRGCKFRVIQGSKV